MEAHCLCVRSVMQNTLLPRDHELVAVQVNNSVDSAFKLYSCAFAVELHMPL